MKLKEHIEQRKIEILNDELYLFTPEKLHELIQEACREQRETDLDEIEDERDSDFSIIIKAIKHNIKRSPLIKTGLEPK